MSARLSIFERPRFLMNVLFVCSRNQWRSPTAECVFRDQAGLNVRSAGTSASARHRVSLKDVEWADIVFTMEKKHRSMLVAEFAEALGDKPMHVLDIPDEYRFMDSELVEQLREQVGPLLGIV